MLSRKQNLPKAIIGVSTAEHSSVLGEIYIYMCVYGHVDI